VVFFLVPLDKRLLILEQSGLPLKGWPWIYSGSPFVDEQEMMNLRMQHGFIFRFLKDRDRSIICLKISQFCSTRPSNLFSLVDTRCIKMAIAQEHTEITIHKQKVMIGLSFAFVRAGSLFCGLLGQWGQLKALGGALTMWGTKGVCWKRPNPDQLRVSF